MNQGKDIELMEGKWVLFYVGLGVIFEQRPKLN